MTSNQESASAPPAVRIVVNGETHALDAPVTVSALLERLGAAGRRVAVEVNRTIVPRSRHDSHLVGDGDEVELVQAIGGG